jgi:acyl carrier protein
MNTLQEQVFDLCAKTFKADKKSLTLETKFIDDMGADSLDLVEFSLSLEDEYRIEVPESEIQNIKTIGDVIRLLEKQSK